MKFVPILLGLVLSAAALAQIAPPAPPLDGKALFQEKCAMCHGPTGMGTGLLKRRVQPAMLEQRTDLAADYVVAAARTGIGNMPAIPRGEVSDAQLKAIAAYLAAKKALPK
jgi:mono/diheme cytochrome c family protein